MLIIHGDNQIVSRNRLQSLLASFKGEIIRLDGKSLDLTIIKQNLESKSLFGQEKFLVIENLFSLRKSQLKEKLLEYLKKEVYENLIIWEGIKIDGRSLLAFSKAKIEKYEIGKIIFRFLDSLTPGNSGNLIQLYHQVLAQNGAELILFMLERQVRQLIMAADLGGKGLVEGPPWKKTILIRQAGKFKLNQLISLYQKLLAIEYNQKTGNASLPLNSQLDLWLASF
jgi:DNA polymerase III delta subunit